MSIFDAWDDGRSCRKCGCTELNACLVQSPFGGPVEGCSWAEPDLCSACAEPETKIRGHYGAEKRIS